MNVQTGDEKEAEQIRGALRALLGMGRLSSPEEHREAVTIFDTMRVVREGPVVRFSADVPYDLLEKTAAQFPSLLGK
jgi:hypothetical protein